MKYFIGVFYILHGLVHLLYMGHSLNYFELEKGFTWPGNSRLLAKIFGLKTNKLIASILCIIAAISFVLSGICSVSGQVWLNKAVITSVIVSTVLFIAFWDGTRNKLHTQGGIAIILNVLVLIYTLSRA